MAKTDATNAAAPEEKVKINRREFVNLAWLASLGFFLVPVGGVTVLFAFPRFKEGEFGGKFNLRLADLPETGASPLANTKGKFWLTRTDEGVRAIYKVCTHLGCIYSWTPANDRFECPCHGSKYRLDGRRIEAPAPRSLDYFKMYALAEDKTTVLAESELSNNFFRPMQIPDGTAFLSIDTGDRKQGPTQVLLCDFSGTCP